MGILRRYKTTWGIIGACFLAVLGVSGEVRAFTTSFETAEGYTINTDVRGQANWWYFNNTGLAKSRS